MSQSQNHDENSLNKLDPNWRNDALDLGLDYGMQTIAVRAGQHRTDEGEHSEPIFTTSSYVYRSAADAAAHFDGTKTGNVYSRHTNPSVRTFERRLAALENGERAVATASGMGAILTMCLAYLKAGDHLLAANQLFGSSIGLFNNYMAKFGVEVSYVDCFDNEAWANAVQPNTKVIYCESPSNPLAQICDIGYLSQLCKANDILLVVDNCFATPALQRPLDLGADVVIHSATKYLDGQGRVLGGALVGSDKLMQEAFTVVRSGGISMSPFNAWVFTKGLETLKLRMQAHCQNANQVAEFLVNHPNVSTVHFSGLSDHPAHELATRQHHMKDGYGAIMGFEVKASDSRDTKEAAWHVIDSTQMVSITNNLGDAKTTITHPATTTHFRLTAEARAEAGVKDGLIRLSVGLEDVEDIIKDLARGLDSL
ncbi:MULTISPECIES: O-succinylhomoserine sulfhydrylase [Psychrobacter]|uniref:O-succinylhomoserine sulfhydrylase n=1 Tax=Psychrobacter TaxID=497 RepID=UPI0008686D74|nr:MULTISPECIES: O-succinylhomoserine sulfhydrylase [Psychrobacter]MBA6244175.1 O-succinylhomoserine sulfhydrylase [Psychrobacter sp. Urea-trap-18]MBA6285261.1 O-succinylhomoserine sulfhydrylase [Psychrobacter sp. Urea-trap-16]MBA6319168.1 O-succinylhomoserine sulfhydrylase [Psychrobacter sp. Urea-trap-20]MBA6333848.1 O-succinylhomoserine sulfhydrylase [Psychrobacter sp. Urea-trap-19]OEH67022.1 MAG: O-succinylhomoserine sulfhydrylase [Psychrobacter sp. B29-1]